MLGTMNTEKEYEDRLVNSKLIEAYKRAHDRYQAACDRYDKLVSAYRVLKGISTENPIGEKHAETNEALPYTEQIMEQMIEDAHKEKELIAGHARECVKHLRTLKYLM